METETLNIIFYPPLSVREYARTLSSSYGDRGTFVLDDSHFYPHITLYMAEYPRTARESVITEVERVQATLPNIHLEADGYSFEHQYIAISYKLTNEIHALQQSIIAACNPLRNGAIRAKDGEKMESYTASQRVNVETYGFRNVGDNYHPHLTLTKLCDDAVIGEVVPIIDLEKLSFTATTIALMGVGEFGTAREMLYVGQ